MCEMCKFHKKLPDRRIQILSEKSSNKKGLLNDSFLKLVHFVVVTRLTFMHKAAQEKMKNVKIRREKESTTAMNANIKKSPNPI